MCVKFKVDRLSRFRSGVCQEFTIQKPLPSKISLTMKTESSNSLNTFSDQITIRQTYFEIDTHSRQTSHAFARTKK